MLIYPQNSFNALIVLIALLFYCYVIESTEAEGCNNIMRKDSRADVRTTTLLRLGQLSS